SHKSIPYKDTLPTQTADSSDIPSNRPTRNVQSLAPDCKVLRAIRPTHPGLALRRCSSPYTKHRPPPKCYATPPPPHCTSPLLAAWSNPLHRSHARFRAPECAPAKSG